MSEFYQMPELPKEKKAEVINYVTSQKEIRTSELQLKFKWGYHRAGKTIDWLHSLGIVSEFNGMIHRDVLMSNEDAQTIISELEQPNPSSLDSKCKKCGSIFDYYNNKPVCPICD